MREGAVPGNLADRTENILRKDRLKLRSVRPPVKQTVLLAFLPNEPEVLDFMDSYMPTIADELNMQYLQPRPTTLQHLPGNYLERARLVVADITGLEDEVLKTVYQSIRMERPVLLLCREEATVPDGLEHLPVVCYEPDPSDAPKLTEAILQVLIGTEP